MALLQILQYPDARLTKIARPVAQVDTRVRQLVDDMIETMYAAEGIGLAATQVDVHERVVVVDVSETRDQPQVLINPQIVWCSDETASSDEGCLSVAGFVEPVERSVEVHVTALDRDGAERRIEADGLLAVCLQHELDHLQGKVFVDRLSALKRNRLRTKIAKRQRDAAPAEGEAPRRAVAAR